MGIKNYIKPSLGIRVDNYVYQNNKYSVMYIIIYTHSSQFFFSKKSQFTPLGNSLIFANSVMKHEIPRPGGSLLLILFFSNTQTWWFFASDFVFFKYPDLVVL
jgi:hypothetical protein